MLRHLISLSLLGSLWAGQCLLAQPSSGALRQPTKQAQIPKKNKSELEELLDKAVKSHPDIQAAEARLQAAGAELEQAKAKVMQQVVQQYFTLRAQRQEAVATEEKLAHIRKLAASKVISATEVRKIEQELIAARAKIEELEAAMRYAIGNYPKESSRFRKGTFNQAKLFWEWHRAAQTEAQQAQMQAERARLAEQLARTMSEKLSKQSSPVLDLLRKALDQPVEMPKEGATLSQLLSSIQKQHKVPIQIRAGELDKKVTGPMSQLSLGALLEWIEDLDPNTRFVVRSYGLLLTSTESLPPGAVTLSTFWKMEPATGRIKK